MKQILKKYYEYDNEIRNKYCHDQIIGVDESGRGALAGPIVVGAVVLSRKQIIKDVADSKKISFAKRAALFAKIITKSENYHYEILPAKTVDKLNPKRATQLGMYKCLQKLQSSYGFAIIDAENLDWTKTPAISVIKADQKSAVVAAASIVAKVIRDNLMIHFAKKQYPYRFDLHKGYGTAQHLAEIKKNGICDLHRQTYKPIRNHLQIAFDF